MLNTLFTLNRMGTFEVKMYTDFQCKQHGHRFFEYHVKIRVINSLDENGFVIDHAEVDAMIHNIVDKPMKSCELVASEVVNTIYREMVKRGSRCKSVYIKLMPIMGDGTQLKAFMEAEVRG
jgi:hypothetical protein